MTITHFEFTYFENGADNVDTAALILHLQKFCRDGIMQVERCGSTERLHVQGHGILEAPVASIQRIINFNRGTKWSTMHVTPSTTTVVDDFKHKRITLEQMYAAKEDTRVRGPYRVRVEDDGKYIPRQQREIAEEELHEWQVWLKEIAPIWDTRSIHIMFNQTGKQGKSFMAQRMRLLSNLNVFQVAVVKDQERLEADMCDKLMQKKCRNPHAIMVDLPRAMPKDHIPGIFAALENIKSGYVNDSRNNAKEWDFDCPNIFVFTNHWPEIGYLSEDRWKFHEIEYGSIFHRDIDYVRKKIQERKDAEDIRRAQKKRKAEQALQSGEGVL